MIFFCSCRAYGKKNKNGCIRYGREKQNTPICQYKYIYVHKI